MLNGIDISKWQDGIDLDAIQTDFVICKATEGVGYTDKTCDKYYQKAKALNKKLGVYHFARPDLGNTAEAEADYFIKETKGYHNEAILILDWEPQGNSIANVAWAKAWLDRVYNITGIKPIIYMSASPANSYDWTSVVNGDYGLWVASYGRNTGKAGTKPTIKQWAFYIMWQYTSKGRLDGYNGNLDLNYFYGDREVWDKYANVSNKPVENVNKTVDELAQEVLNGLWGNGSDRRRRLEAAGHNYTAVQARVNQILYGNKKSIDEVANEVIRGDWGNGAERKRRLEAAGYNYKTIQDRVNKILYG